MSYGGIVTKTLKFEFFRSGTFPSLQADSARHYRFDFYWTPNNSALMSYIDTYYSGNLENYFATKIGIHDVAHYLLNLGTYFLNNYRVNKNIGYVECVDCIGFMKSVTYKYDGGYSADPKNPVMRYVVNEIETLTGLHWIALNTSEKFPLGNTLKLGNAADWNGSTCYDVVMEICKACTGYCKSVFGNRYDDLAFSIVYANQLKTGSAPIGWSGADTFTMEIPASDVFSSKYARTSYSFSGAQYLGNGYTYGSQNYLTVQANVLWDYDIQKYKTNSDQQTETVSLLQTKAFPLWAGFGSAIRPMNVVVNSAPYYESLDAMKVWFGTEASATIMVTSVTMNDMGTMTLTCAGEIDPQQNYITGGGKVTSNVAKNTAQLNSLSRVFDVGENSLGVGRTAATSNIPANGRADVDMDVYLNGAVRFGNNNLKYITHQALTSSAQLSSAGWYRIATWAIGASTTAGGATGILVNVAVATQYQGSNNTLHKISLIGVYNKASFIDETSVSNTNGITKIRYMVSTSGNGAIDVYYELNTANLVRVDLEPYFARGFVAEDFTAVLASPADENELANYTFSDNAQSGIIVTTESVTTSNGGYVSFSSTYPPSQYFILSATTTKSDAFVRLTGSSSGQWIRVLTASGSAVASETITVKLAMLKLS